MTLDEIKQRAEAATPGPWHIEYGHEFDVICEPKHELPQMGNKLFWSIYPRANAEFIAEARTDIPKLLKIIELYESVMHDTNAVLVSAKVNKILEGE